LKKNYFAKFSLGILLQASQTRLLNDIFVYNLLNNKNFPSNATSIKGDCNE